MQIASETPIPQIRTLRLTDVADVWGRAPREHVVTSKYNGMMLPPPVDPSDVPSVEDHEHSIRDFGDTHIAPNGEIITESNYLGNTMIVQDNGLDKHDQTGFYSDHLQTSFIQTLENNQYEEHDPRLGLGLAARSKFDAIGSKTPASCQINIDPHGCLSAFGPIPEQRRRSCKRAGQRNTTEEASCAHGVVAQGGVKSSATTSLRGTRQRNRTVAQSNVKSKAHTRVRGIRQRNSTDDGSGAHGIVAQGNLKNNANTRVRGTRQRRNTNHGCAHGIVAQGNLKIKTPNALRSNTDEANANEGVVSNIYTVSKHAAWPHCVEQIDYTVRLAIMNTTEATEKKSVSESLAHNYVRLNVKSLVCVVTIGTILAMVVTALGVATLPLEVDTSFETFLKTDVESSVMLDAWRQAIDSRQKSRRLTQPNPNWQLDEFVNPSERFPNAVENLGDLAFGTHGIGASDRRLAGYMIKELYVTYEVSSEFSSSRGLFDEEAVAAIASFERQIRAVPKYKELCSRVDDAYQRLCNPGISFVNIAAPTAATADDSIVPRNLTLDGRGTDFVPLQLSLYFAKRHDMAEIFLPRYVTDELGTPESITKTTLLRSVFRFRLPTDEGGVNAITTEWASFLRELLPVLRSGCNCNKFKVFFDGTDFLGIQIKEALESDIRLAVFGAVFVLLYLCFHTRSLLLAVMGLLLTMLSVPLSFICSAVIAGTTTVSFASFLALFLVVGFGSDVIFVYTDFWRDSAMHYEAVEDRLVWMFKTGTRTSLATSCTTALAFFANLASVVRALREFGFFMGLCVMTVWVLITFLYTPLLVIDEVYFGEYHFRGCWKRSALLCGDEAATDVEQQVSDRTAMRASYWDTWITHIHHWRRSWCCLPILAAIVCAAWAGSSATLMQGLPDMFSDGHNMIAGEPIMLQFTPTADAIPLEFSKMPESENVCNEQRFGQDSKNCSLFWCESSWSSSPDTHGESCKCSRRDRFTPSCGFESTRSFEVVQRVVHPVEINSKRIKKAVESHWKARAYSGADAIRFPSWQAPSDSVEAAKSLPILQHEWDTGDVVMGRVTEVKTTLQKESNSAVDACGWEELCYCGKLVCHMDENMWSEAPRLHMSSSTSDRSADRGPDTASMPGERRLGWPLFLEQRPRVAITQSPRRLQTDMTIVQVGFGMKVQRTMPVLGMNSDVWDFQKDFSLDNPWAQRSLYNFCRDFPDHFLVKRKRCWMEDFREWLRSKDQRWPAFAHDFEVQAMAYINTGNTKTSGTHYIWLHETKIKAMMVAVGIGLPATVPPATGLQHKKYWDECVDKFNEHAESEVQGAFHVSGLWVICEMQSALFVGTAWTLVILLGLAFVGMLAFTRSLILSLFVVLSTIVVIMFLAFYIVIVAGWELGLIEIIALIYFIGYAVTYSLHVAHKYAGNDTLQHEAAATEEKPPTNHASKVRLQRTSFSLKAIGGAALGSAATTAGTSFFLVFCELTVFTKLGAMCLAVTTLSIVTALGPLPAILMVGGPVHPGRSKVIKSFSELKLPKLLPEWSNIDAK